MPLTAAKVSAENAFPRQLDPNGRLDYTIDWSAVLVTNTVANIVTTLSPESIAAGLIMDGAVTEGDVSTVRFSVAPESRDDTAWGSTNGVDLSFKQNMEDSTGQLWEFSFKITVKQQ